MVLHWVIPSVAVGTPRQLPVLVALAIGVAGLMHIMHQRDMKPKGGRSQYEADGNDH